jgi:acetyltransferase-like isoleucine patch superfamily enzyme
VKHAVDTSKQDVVDVSVILVADVRAPAIEVALNSTAAAIEEAETTGLVIETIIVVTRADPAITALLECVSGAQILARVGASRADAFQTGIAASRGATLWLTTAETAPAPSALRELIAEVTVGSEIATADPVDPAPFALFRRDALLRLPSLATMSPGHDPLPSLIEEGLTRGMRVGTVLAAGCVRQRLRFPTTEISRGMRVWASRPEAVQVGPATYGAPQGLAHAFGPLDEIEIGGYCAIADDVKLLVPVGRTFDERGQELTDRMFRDVHKQGAASTFPIGDLVPDEPYDTYPPGARGERMMIGDDVWIGYRATLIGGITVGPGAIIGAGALVRSDVPAYALVAGVPARVVRMRFEPEVVAQLQAMRWWDWHPEIVKGAHWWFGRPVEEFLRHFDLGTVARISSDSHDGNCLPDAGEALPELSNSCQA